MSVTFHIGKELNAFTKGKSRLAYDASPKTIAEALALLWAQYPGLRDRVLTAAGEIQPNINIMVWNQSIRYSGGLTTPLPKESDVFIVQQ